MIMYRKLWISTTNALNEELQKDGFPDDNIQPTICDFQHVSLKKGTSKKSI